ncbi:Hypothetical protein NGAL_HAMBI2610_49560 [Neorhizobium galegae bv. orientalis]|nr:Hypothetical protein NGAL_HAMBI2610_49560 [Neorhizobium galegae bv. orientalis]
MALSEAEWKRRQEEEDAEPAYFGMTWGEFRRLPERQQQETRQRLSQLGATHVGFWKDCTLGKCRRARRCVGFLSEAQYKAGYNAAYPPCARAEEPRRAKIYYDGICRLFPEGDEQPKYDGRRKTGEGDE